MFSIERLKKKRNRRGKGNFVVSRNVIKKKLKLHDVECLRRKRKRKCFPKINIRQSQQWFLLGFQLFGSRYCEHAMVISLIYRKSLIGLRLRLRPFSAMTFRVSRRARKALKKAFRQPRKFLSIAQRLRLSDSTCYGLFKIAQNKIKKKKPEWWKVSPEKILLHCTLIVSACRTFKWLQQLCWTTNPRVTPHTHRA